MVTYTILYSVTPKPDKQAFLNIENLCVYYSNLKVVPGTVLLPTIHGKISCL